MHVALSALVSVLLLFLTQAGRSQTTEIDIKNRLAGKALYIRGFWGEDTLHFDSMGQLIGASDQIPFTLSGIDVEGVHLEKDALILDGDRIGLKFKDNRPIRVALKAGAHAPLRRESMRITIDRPSNGDFGHALDVVFANDLSDADLAFPTYWKRYVRDNFLPAGSSTSTETTEKESAPPNKIGGVVKPPKLVKSVEPQFSQAARI